MKKSIKFLLIFTVGLIFILIMYFIKFKFSLQNKQELNTVKYNFKLFNAQNSISYNDYMDYMNGIYYKKISDYNEYKEYKKIWPDILEMTEDSFDNNFMIITATENISMSRLTLGEVYTQDDTLYVGLKKVTNAEEFNEENNGISIIIDKELDSKEIEVFKTIETKEYLTNYINIKDLPYEYSISEAMSDNCVIIENNKCYNIEQFNEFISKTSNSINSEIRIVIIDEATGMEIMDIKYIDSLGKYIVCRDRTRIEPHYQKYNYYEYNSFEKSDIDEGHKYTFINSETNEKLELYTK